MSLVSVIARIPCQPGRRDELVAALGDYFPQVEAEDGTLLYAISTDNGDDDLVWVYELYTGDEALQAHSTSPAFQSLAGTLGGLLSGPPELHFCRPVRAKGHVVEA